MDGTPRAPTTIACGPRATVGVGPLGDAVRPRGAGAKPGSQTDLDGNVEVPGELAAES